jgi:hypothetical protein
VQQQVIHGFDVFGENSHRVTPFSVKAERAPVRFRS